MLQHHIAEYLENFSFSFTEQICSKLCGVSITIDVMMFEDRYQRRQKAHVRLEKGSYRYECLCVDLHNWENMFHPVTLNGRQLLCFRKSLYGLTLLDAETLEEVYEYFPVAVLEGEESFIIVHAQSGFDLLFLDGCYWADSYSTFVFDPATRQFANLSKAVGLEGIDSGMCFKDGQLVLNTDPIYKNAREIHLSEQEIRGILAREGATDM